MCKSFDPLGALLSSLALDVRLPTALQVLQVCIAAIGLEARLARRGRAQYSICTILTKVEAHEVAAVVAVEALDVLLDRFAKQILGLCGALVDAVVVRDL